MTLLLKELMKSQRYIDRIGREEIMSRM